MINLHESVFTMFVSAEHKNNIQSSDNVISEEIQTTEFAEDNHHVTESSLMTAEKDLILNSTTEVSSPYGLRNRALQSAADPQETSTTGSRFPMSENNPSEMETLVNGNVSKHLLADQSPNGNVSKHLLADQSPKKKWLPVFFKISISITNITVY